MLSVDTSNLDVVFVGNGVEEILSLHKLWEINMNGGSKTGTEVGWAVRNVTEMVVVGEFCLLLNLGGSDGKSLEDLEDVGSLLHGDKSELILFVDPHKESFVVIVEDTSSLWPVSLESSRLQVLVTTLEEEVISDQLLSLGIGHVWKGIVFTLKLTIELTESGGNELFNLKSIISRDSRSEWEGSEVSGNSNSSGVDHLVLISWEWWAVQVLVVHVGDVLGIWSVSVISFNDLIEEWSEGIVRVMGSSIDTNTRVGPFAS